MPETPHQSPRPPTVICNWQDWLGYLTHIDASDAEKRQLIETLWSIMLAFVDLGWDLDTGKNTCGQSIDLTAVLRAAVVNSEERTSQPSSSEAIGPESEAV